MSPTQRQLDALRFIRGYQLAHAGLSPTCDEIAAGIGLRAKSGAFRLLEGLAERGLIRRPPERRQRCNRWQAIEVLTEIPIPRSPEGEPLYFVRLP